MSGRDDEAEREPARSWGGDAWSVWAETPRARVVFSGLEAYRKVVSITPSVILSYHGPRV